MKPLFLTLLLIASGCASFDRTAFNATNTAVTITDAGMTAYGSYYRTAISNPEAYHTTTNALASQRKQLSAVAWNVGISAELAEKLRRAYRTNSAVRPQLEATIITLGENASNVTWTVNQILKP